MFEISRHYFQLTLRQNPLTESLFKNEDLLLDLDADEKY